MNIPKTIVAIAIFMFVSAGCTLPGNTQTISIFATPQLGSDTSLLVNTLQDTFDGDCTKEDCSLRDAIYEANHTSVDEIVLPVGLYELNGQIARNDDSGIYGDLDITSKVIILGFGINETKIDGAFQDRIFHIHEGAYLELHDLSLFGGRGDDPAVKRNNRQLAGFNHMVDELGGGAIANRGTLVLTQVSIEHNLALIGGGLLNAGQAEINGGYICNNHSRLGAGIFNIGSLKISGVKICSNQKKRDPEDWPGLAEDENNWEGGGIYNDQDATLLVEDSEITENGRFGPGMGIYNATNAQATISNSLITYNSGWSGISNHGVLTILGVGSEHTLIAGQENIGVMNSGAANLSRVILLENSGEALSSDGTLEVHESLIASNHNVNGPAGLSVYGGSVKLTNVTFGTNKSDVAMGTIYVESGFLEALNVTLFENQTIGIINRNGQVNLKNTILANNDGGNCIGEVVSYGFNLESEDTCGLRITGDQPSTSAGLIPDLFSNDFTYMLLSESQAHDAGDNEFCPSVDQQNEPRPMGISCDIGADEFAEGSPTPRVQNPEIPTVPPAPPTITPNAPTPITPTLTITLSPPDPMNANISGVVWNDTNGDGSKQGGETGLAVQAVQLGTGACDSSGFASRSSDFGGGYSFTGLAAGTYCVSVQRAEGCGDVSAATTPKEVTIVLGPGQNGNVSFGFQKKIC